MVEPFRRLYPPPDVVEDLDLPWNAAKERDRLSKQMTAEQVAESQKLSRELYNRIESSKSD